MPDYAGILIIGDPHLASRPPGFRRDDYPAVILRKLAWCLDYARQHRLLPALLGDIFDRPRDNANWVLGELLALLGRQTVLAIYGNHDCRENTLSDDDSLSVVTKSGLLRLIDEKHPWAGTIGGTQVLIGGTPWGARLPRSFSWQQEIPDDSDPLTHQIPATLFDNAQPADTTRSDTTRSDTTQAHGLHPMGANHPAPPPHLSTKTEPRAPKKPTLRLTFWLAHHDVRSPHYDAGHFDSFEIPGIDVIINGHIHRPLPDVQRGTTLWITPGNIARIARSDMTRNHTPAALEILITAGQYTRRTLTVPHEPYSDIFHPEVQSELASTEASAFVQGLSELQSRRTESGAGLRQFLELNQESLAPDVRTELWNLFTETEHAPTQ